MKITDAELQAITESQGGMEKKVLGNGSVVWRGPWLRDAWYDTYAECLRDNMNHHRINIAHKKAGLNEHAQTPEQAKAFELAKKQQAQVKQQALVAEEMLKKT